MPLDEPIRLALEASEPQAVRTWSAALAEQVDLRLERIDVVAESEPVEVTLTPYPGRRVSIGRFLPRSEGPVSGRKLPSFQGHTTRRFEFRRKVTKLLGPTLSKVE